MGQQSGRSHYGMSNLEYDIVTTLSNLGQEALQQYARDAEQAGDQETARIFQQIQDHNRQAAQQLRQALAKALGGAR